MKAREERLKEKAEKKKEGFHAYDEVSADFVCDGSDSRFSFLPGCFGWTGY